MRDGTLETNFLNFLTDYVTRTALQKESGLYAASCAMSLRGSMSHRSDFRIQHHTQETENCEKKVAVYKVFADHL